MQGSRPLHPFCYGASPPEQQDNRRNGSSGKTLRSDHGSFEVQLPCDRKGTFEPQLVGKHQRDFNGFDDKILSMYARGMSTREIRAHLEELYRVDVSLIPAGAEQWGWTVVSPNK